MLYLKYLSFSVCFLNVFWVFSQDNCTLDVWSVGKSELNNSFLPLDCIPDEIEQIKNEIDIIYSELENNLHQNCHLTSRIIINEMQGLLFKINFSRSECRRKLKKYEIEKIRSLVNLCEKGTFYQDCIENINSNPQTFDYNAILFMKKEKVFEYISHIYNWNGLSEERQKLMSNIINLLDYVNSLKID